MEALLRNLQEQEIQLQLQQQHLYLDDLANMENSNDRKPPLPPPRKYISVFHIDGEPILPPLMTSEKRRQMQKLKDKALKIEQSIRERKQRQQGENVLNNEDLINETSNTSLYNAGCDDISHRSQNYYDSKIQETEESMILLQNLIKRQQGSTETKPMETSNTACNTSMHIHRDENQEKLQKLQKSEIIIYDNSTNEVIQVVPAENDNMTFEEQQRTLREVEQKANLNYVIPKKPSHLLLAGVNSKGLTSIPAICLNPPTPLTINRNICETLSGGETNESMSIFENSNKSLDLADELSSDESFNSMVTQTDQRSAKSFCKNMPTKPPRCGNVERKSLTPVKNVSAKIQQFEAISSDSNTPQTSPEKQYKPRKSCLGLATNTISRSATSPSIQLNPSNRSSSSATQSLVQDSDNSPENNLVRSSSFTLEEPSKALIDHMQLQKATNDRKTVTKSPLNAIRSVTRKPISSPLRAHRDTVESKAKKVQKVELKSSKLKIQQKASQSKLAQAAAASISPYNTTALTQHTTNLCKTKRSPYDLTKTSQTSLQTLQKTSSTQMRKSNSTSSNLSQSKISKSRPSSATKQTPNSGRSLQTGQESFNYMEKTQKEKFLRLLAQQEEEHRRLQQSFEVQQKMLIEQLNREMAASHLKSPNNSYSSSTTTTSGHYKRLDQQPLSPRPTDTGSQKQSTLSVDLKQHNSHTSPSSISNNSSTLSNAKYPSQTANFQHSSYGSQYTHSIPLNSHLSLMDHSNANTSLDISTLSNQTSPDTLCATPTTQPNSDNNTVGNKTSNSTSRRRLFGTEINDIAVVGNGISSRSTVSLSGGRQVQPAQRSIHTNKSPKTLINNDSNRRSSVDNSLLLHAAATKINACARGFLVRRLFQTEQIQRIVQTIRDTLIFVLNLHMETMENPEESQTPANIKLKARLLQQLSSACRTLHLVFFQTSIKERMEIIARDRKRIKTKLLSINRRRTPRIAG